MTASRTSPQRQCSRFDSGSRSWVMESEWLPQLVGYPEGSRLQNILGMLVTYFLLQDLVFGTGNGAAIGINRG